MILAPWKLIWRCKNSLIATTLVDFKAKYAGSILGLWWAFLSPILFLSVYTIVYLHIFKLQPTDMTSWDYIIRIFSGLVPFMMISESLAVGTSSVSSNKELLRNTVFPAELIPLRSVLISIPSFLFSLVILLVMSVVNHHISIFFLVLPIVIILQVMFIVGVVWILSPINLAFKDIQNLLNFIVLILMIASPIAYTEQMVPEKYLFILHYNPISPFIQTYQEILVNEQLPNIFKLVKILVLSLSFFYCGFTIFTKVKNAVVNYVQ